MTALPLEKQVPKVNYRNVFVKSADEMYTALHNGVANIDTVMLVLRGILDQKFPHL